uniref:Thioredoxin F-type, chloroplastic n=1 Tax=Mesembryanthemum crystallinum TaxID=3544 RepID=TRXF_MESCR|nr:RecName: Full=Thioredoxin F-type, chloroplastic; Short=Trx-F; Flags: Precursor [Mesembryanthemum crystallinum]AAC19392.1 thioredoxin F precursor [Mesembryanthemum crystallinum]
MAMQLSLSHQSWAKSLASPITSFDPARSPPKRVELGPNCLNGGATAGKLMREKVGERMRMSGRSCCVKASLETAVGAESETLVGKVTEVDKDTFWPIANGAGDKPVVLDMYTQWCGPCKVMAPKYQELAEKLLDVVFLKLDCNQENKPLAKELGIRVVPTFKILKGGKIVDEVTGAKFDKLVAAIEAARSS